MSRRIALIVGVSQYEPHTKLGNLSAPVNDAQRVYDVLSEYGGFDMLYPLPLADGKVGSSGKVLAQALRDKLREVLNPQAGEEVELAVFYFSGHGVSHHGMASYLSATDDSLAVPLSFLTELVEDSTVKNLCIWLDCCHSGEVLKFKTSEKKSFCLVAASTADGEALAKNGQSLLTEILCEALTPDQDRPEIRVMEFVDYLEAHRKNLPQQVLFRGNSAFTLTQYHGEVSVASPYPPDHAPYKGLLTFTQIDREFFFGRDGMIQQLLDKLSASRFVPLLGASGSGKSSLVLAGLLPKLPDSDWQVLVMRPTAEPLQNLRDTLVRGFPDAQVGTLASGADLQREVLRLVTAGKRLLLVIDQFEEVFTECRDDAARTAFFACLLEALDGDNPLHLVLTLRADFLGHCTEQAYSGLGQRLQHHALLLVAPTAGELREAITRPLALVGMRCEQALEDELIDQTLHAKGSLPLLQYVLEKLWQSARQEPSRELTLDMYKELNGYRDLDGKQIGGLRGVLNEKADAFYQQLEPQQQRLMEWLMVELTQVGDGQDDTRRTVTLQELHNRQPQYTEALDALLAQLVTQERLLTQDHDDHGQATITVAHEALIRDWQRLRDWLESNREIKSWRLRLEDSITAWKNNVSGSLLREKRLAEAQQIVDRNPNSLLVGQDEKEFIQVSIDQEQREQIERIQLALVGKLAMQAEVARRWSVLGNGLDQALLLAAHISRMIPDSPVALATLGNVMRDAGNLVQTLYTESEVVTVAFSPNGKFIISGGYGKKTLRMWDVASGRLVGQPWHRYEEWVEPFVFSPDSKFVVSSSTDNTLRRWDAVTGQLVGEPWCGHEDRITAVAFSPDGKLVVSSSIDKTLRLWDAVTGEPIGEPWQVKDSYVWCFTFSPDGRYIVSGNRDYTVQLWNVSKRQPIGMLSREGTTWLKAIAFSPDGTFVVGSTGHLRLWNVVRWRWLWRALKWSWLWKVMEWLWLLDVMRGRLEGEAWDGYAGDSIAISPDSKFVVSGGEDKKLRLWDSQAARVIGDLWVGHEHNVYSVAFSPDGKFIVSGSRDKTLRLWNVAAAEGGLLGKSWRGHECDVNSVAFSPDGRFVVSGGGGGDCNLHLWDVATGQAIGKPWCGHEYRIFSVAFSRDGKFVVSGGEDKTLRLWNVATGQSLGEPWRGHEERVKSVAFSPDGKFVISGSWDNTLRLWDAKTGQSLGASWRGHEEWVESVAFSPDGKFVVSGSKDNTLRLWETKTGQSVGRLRWHKNTVVSVAFSPNGKFVVSGSEDNTLCLWDVMSGRLVGEPWYGHKGVVSSVAFSPNGRFVVSGSEDNTLCLWDVTSGRLVGEPWRGHENKVMSVAFSSDGKLIVSGSHGWGKNLRLWDADPESWAKKACSIVNRNFSLAEWQRFIGDALPYEKTCPDLPAPGEEGWVEPYAGG